MSSYRPSKLTKLAGAESNGGIRKNFDKEPLGFPTAPYNK